MFCLCLALRHVCRAVRGGTRGDKRVLARNPTQENSVIVQKFVGSCPCSDADKNEKRHAVNALRRECDVATIARVPLQGYGGICSVIPFGSCLALSAYLMS